MFQFSKTIIGMSLLSGLLHCSGGCDRKSAAAPPPPPPQVEVTHPLRGEVTDYADYVGRTEAIDSVQVRARASGYLQNVNFKEGELVKKGQVLFEIDPRVFEAQVASSRAQVASAEATLKRARSDNARYQELAANTPGAVSKQDVDKFQAVADQAIADLQAAQAALAQNQLNLGWTKVTAPLDGRISRYFATIGNLITQDQTVLTTIVSTGRIYAYFDMDDTTVLRVRQLTREGKAKFGQEGGVAPVYLRLENEKGFPHQGQINFEENTITPRTGTLRVRGVFANQDGALQPGYFVRLRVPIGTPHQALLVPDRAIDNDQGRKVLRVVNEKNQVVSRRIQVGAMDGGFRVIADGLEHDDRVIVTGLLQARPGATVQPKFVNLPTRATGAGNSQLSAQGTED
jgi:RND family efflux transporter MFP subunit